MLAATFRFVPTKKRRPEGAQYGTVQASRLINLSPEMDKQARAAAKAEGVTISEWWRRAAQKALKKR